MGDGVWVDEVEQGWIVEIVAHNYAIAISIERGMQF